MNRTTNSESPVGLHAVIRDLGLKVPLPIIRSVITGGTRQTRITNVEIREQYPKSYQPEKTVVAQLRFALSSPGWK